MSLEAEDYWKGVDPPMSFVSENWSYTRKRAFRFNTLDYLHDVVAFARFRKKSILCVGEGSGIDAVEFAQHGAEVSIVDLSPKAVTLTQRLFEEAKLSNRLRHAQVANAYALPHKDRTFDAVYAFGLLHHLERPKDAAAEAFRVLKPNGIFFGMVYNRESLLYAYSILARAHDERLSEDEAMSAYSERIPGCPISRAYTKKELTELLNNNFDNLVINAHYSVVDIPSARKVRVTIHSDHPVGWHLFFEGNAKK